jgi:SAM-dependent methyltransferase
MSFYGHYAGRVRNKYGEKVKIRFAEKIFKSAIEGFTLPPRILEIGPGDGYIASIAKNNRIDYLGLEGSQSVFDTLSAMGHTVVKSFVPPLPNDIGEYDICIALHVIEHLNSMTEAIELIAQIKKYLSRNGKLIIATPDYLKWGKDFYNCDYTHNLPFTVKRLTQLISNEGLKIEYAGHYVGDSFGFLRYPLFWLGKLLYLRGLDNILKNSLKSDIWYRAYLTCLPNIIVIAIK